MNNQSPIPSEDKKVGEVFSVLTLNGPMTFPDAIKQVIKGKKITRIEWKDAGHYGVLKNEVLCLFRDGKNGDTFYSWIINDGDLFATDWVVVEGLN